MLTRQIIEMVENEAGTIGGPAGNWNRLDDAYAVIRAMSLALGKDDTTLADYILGVPYPCASADLHLEPILNAEEEREVMDFRRILK